MDNDVASKLNTLQDWEQYFISQVRQVELLGEITITSEECVQLGQQIGDFIRVRQDWGILKIVEEISRKCPCSFAVFLVAQGVHGYGGPEGFWPGVHQTIGLKLDSNWHREFGQSFEDTLDHHHLPLFLGMGGRRYVDLILVHGGIPNYCMADYFNNMLRPAVTREIYTNLSAEELIDDWLHHASGRYLVDKPVLRFLEFGGEVAKDFVERSRELAREFLESGVVPLAEEVGLPRRVVEAFDTWAVEKNGLGPPDQPQHERTGLRLHKPEIRLDPWGEGLTLDLLPQQIPATLSQARLEWIVKADGRLLNTIPVRLRRVGYDLRTTEASLLLERPAEQYEVSLQIDGDTRRTWLYNGSSQERPMMVFDPTRSTLLRPRNSLPACPLWLLYPRDATIHFEGEASKIKAFPRLPWGWVNFQGEAWDLSQASKLTLYRNTEEIFTIPIRPDEASRRPHLVGGNLFTTSTSAAPTPLYIGIPPVLRIPLVGRTSLIEELTRWRLTLRSPWVADPQMDLPPQPLSDLRPHLIFQDGYADLPLNIPELLGDRPIGSYVIYLRGPLGRDAELPLRLLPHLHVTGHENIHLPHPETGPPEIRLLIETSADTRIEGQAEAELCQVNLWEQRADCATYEAFVAPEIIEIRLTVVKPTGDDEAIRIPVRIPLRRLRWALAGSKLQADAQSLERTGRMIKQPLDALEQATSPILFVDLGQPVFLPSSTPDPRYLEPETLSLHLVDLDNQELQRHEVTKPPRGQGRSAWRFELAAFMDTIRYSSSPVVRFELEYPTLDGPVRLPVLSLTRSMVVSEANVQSSPPIDGQVKIKLTWQETARLRHRRVRFWPLWRPWLPYHEEIIPDDAEEVLEFYVSATHLPPIGAYLLEFVVVDPWVGSASVEKPLVSAPNIVVVEMISPAERIAQIRHVIQQQGPRLDLFLERAHIRAQISDIDGAKADCKRCHQSLGEATIPQILSLCDLVRENMDSLLLGPLRVKMFAANHIQQLLDQQTTGDVTPAQFEAYMANLPQKLLPLPTCEKLLTVNDEKIQMYAILQLIRRGESRGVSAVLGLVKNKALSYTNAAEILKLNQVMAEEFLKQRLDDPIAPHLLERLSPDQSPIVRVGHWVRSLAGWGQITKIEEIESTRSLEYFVKEQSNLRLHVTLRPQHDALPVTIEVLTDRQYLHFESVHKLCRCTEAGCGFITQSQDLLRIRKNINSCIYFMSF